MKKASYGSWKSPISSDLVVARSVKLSQIALDSNDIYWVEMRPEEGGRNVIVHCDASGTLSDVTPTPYNVRSRVHEYGGGAFAVRDGVICFCNDEDQRIYRQRRGEQPVAVTPEEPSRYADGVLDASSTRMYCVREDHSTPKAPQNTIICLDLTNGKSGRILVSGNDFYASPRLSPDGSKLVWLTWNHPNMPWDSSELWIGDLESDGSLTNPRKLAGDGQESIFQPEWSPNGTLHCVSDRTGWWNLYQWQEEALSPLTEETAEFGVPLWMFGSSTYAFESDRQIVCSYFSHGAWRLAILETATGKLEQIDLPYSEIEEVRAGPGRAVFKGGAPSHPSSIIRLDLRTKEAEAIRQATSITVSDGYLSQPQAIEFPTERGLTAHAYYYPPKNCDFEARPGELPPLIVKSHGGPTGSTSTTLELRIQFWTSRGFAILDVNYGGSTGYGREYRQRLDGNWGITDVDDCVNGAKYLVERGLVDRSRVAIAGGSAGGYTTLAALTFRDFFKAGASYYGISDLEALARDTHKFESRYLDRLIGPYPREKKLYVERSPIHHVERLSCPIIMLQGAEDKVVPANQAETMFEAVKDKGLPVAYVLFEGEQHGFRRAESIKRALEAELYFYSKVFGFELADEIEPIKIENVT